MSAQQNIETLKNIYAAFGRGDVAGVLAGLADDVTFDAWKEHAGQANGVAWMQPRRGKDGAVAFLQTLATELPLEQFEVRSMMVGEQQIAVDVQLAGKVAKTGKRLSDEEIHLWTFNAAGKATSFRQYVDTAKHIAASR